MAIPEQIRKQAEAVQELYKQLGAEETGTENAGENADAETTAAPDTSTPADSTVANNATPAPVSEQKAGADNVQEDVILQKYKTLQGMYNAEVPRLHQQNKEMQQRLQQMEQLLASVGSTKTTQPQTTTAERLISDKDVAEYGESLDVMRKVTREELHHVAQRIASIELTLKQMQSQVVPQVQAVVQRQQVSAEQQFWSDLSSVVPNFRQINDNDDFQTWLLQPDPLTGITRQTYLDDAQRALDARRVANFFHTWLESTGQASVARPVGSVQNSELEKQVSPGKSRSVGAPAINNQGRTYTPQDIQKFFNDVRAGKYKGREQERAKIERDIFAAQRENRIQMNA